MPTHKFHVGQFVQLIPSISRNVPGGSYEIIKKHPGATVNLNTG